MPKITPKMSRTIHQETSTASDSIITTSFKELFSVIQEKSSSIIILETFLH